MVNPFAPTPVELEQYGLGVVLRGARFSTEVTLFYCLHCGTQVSPERRETDPNGWWECARKCNTLYAHSDASRNPPPRVAP